MAVVLETRLGKLEGKPGQQIVTGLDAIHPHYLAPGSGGKDSHYRFVYSGGGVLGGRHAGRRDYFAPVGGVSFPVFAHHVIESVTDGSKTDAIFCGRAGYLHFATEGPFNRAPLSHFTPIETPFATPEHMQASLYELHEQLRAGLRLDDAAKLVGRTAEARMGVLRTTLARDAKAMKVLKGFDPTMARAVATGVLLAPQIDVLNRKDSSPVAADTAVLSVARALRDFVPPKADADADTQRTHLRLAMSSMGLKMDSHVELATLVLEKPSAPIESVPDELVKRYTR